MGEEGWGRAHASCPEEVAEELACKLSTISTQIKDNFYFINAVKLHYCLNIITLPTLKRRQGREGERIRKSKRYRERQMWRAGEREREREEKWNGGSKRACLKDVMNALHEKNEIRVQHDLEVIDMVYLIFRNCRKNCFIMEGLLPCMEIASTFNSVAAIRRRTVVYM